MPREITILAERAPDLEALASAAEGIAGATEVREIEGGAASQVVTLRGEPLLTLYHPRILRTVGEVERLLPSAASVELPVFWCDAYAPWGDAGEAGVSIALRLALGVGATCVVED